MSTLTLIDYLVYPIGGVVWTLLFLSQGLLGWALVTGIVTVLLLIYNLCQYFKLRRYKRVLWEYRR